MNIDDYENKYISTYEAFAETVRFILEKALLAVDGLPQPQSIQCRAKGIKSLRRRLAEAKNLNTQTLELCRRDLAGARLIFYTNNDVERFLASRLIHENFEIEEDSTKIHHPTPENEGKKYRAVPACEPEFASALADLVKAGVDTEADFALAVIQNYHGVVSAFPALKEIVSRFPDDVKKMSEVRAAIDNAGVVTGEFGLAEAWRAKKDSLKEWLSDERPAVKGFAEKHISELDLMITSEQRRAESEKEMRHRGYD